MICTSFWNKRGLLVVLMAWAVSVPSLLAQPAGLTGFPFLRLEPSARAAALGGSFTAVYGDDVNALFYNPAILNEEMHGVLSASYLNHLSDLNAGFVAYGRHMDRWGTLAVGLRYMNYGSFERADETGARDGTTFGASDVALSLGWARTYYDWLRYGASIQGIFSGIDSYSAGALAFDAGVLAYWPDRALSASLTIHNTGWVLSSFGDLADELPFDLRLGLTKKLAHLPLMITLMGYNLHELGEGEGSFTSETLRHLAVGTEFQFSSAFNLRLGYNHRRHEELKTNSRIDLAGVGLGFGLKVTRFRFDYAYNAWSALGGLHQLTVRTVL